MLSIDSEAFVPGSAGQSAPDDGSGKKSGSAGLVPTYRPPNVHMDEKKEGETESTLQYLPPKVEESKKTEVAPTKISQTSEPSPEDVKNALSSLTLDSTDGNDSTSPVYQPPGTDTGDKPATATHLESPGVKPSYKPPGAVSDISSKEPPDSPEVKPTYNPPGQNKQGKASEKQRKATSEEANLPEYKPYNPPIKPQQAAQPEPQTTKPASQLQGNEAAAPAVPQQAAHVQAQPRQPPSVQTSAVQMQAAPPAVENQPKGARLFLPSRLAACLEYVLARKLVEYACHSVLSCNREFPC